jgi:isocitrate dehydrogenase
MHIFRENTEDIYAGIEFMTGTPENHKLIDFLQKELNVKEIRFPETSSLGIKPVSREGSERLVKAAIEFAVEKKLPSVTLVHKGNIMKFTEGSFMNWGYSLAETQFADKIFSMRQFKAIEKRSGWDAAGEALRLAQHDGKVVVKDVIADAFLQEILLHPSDYSVVATLNLNGDYISDSLAAMVGGIGIAPGANINYSSGHAIFEATHGTAPSLAGKNLANPGSLILSAVMMLEYIGWNEAANLIVDGLGKAIQNNKVTIDFHEQMPGSVQVSTMEFAEELVSGLDA